MKLVAPSTVVLPSVCDALGGNTGLWVLDLPASAITGSIAVCRSRSQWWRRWMCGHVWTCVTYVDVCGRVWTGYPEVCGHSRITATA